MALSRVNISPDAWIACSTHALSTEAEEVMGLLLGDIRQVHHSWILQPFADEDQCMLRHQTPWVCVQEQLGGALTAHIWMAVPQIRTDRRKVCCTAWLA